MIKIGDKVIITDEKSAYSHQTGTVIAIYEDKTHLRYLVNVTIWPGTKLSPTDNVMFLRQHLRWTPSNHTKGDTHVAN